CPRDNWTMRFVVFTDSTRMISRSMSAYIVTEVDGSGVNPVVLLTCTCVSAAAIAPVVVGDGRSVCAEAATAPASRRMSARRPLRTAHPDGAVVAPERPEAHAGVEAVHPAATDRVEGPHERDGNPRLFVLELLRNFDRPGLRILELHRDNREGIRVQRQRDGARLAVRRRG